MNVTVEYYPLLTVRRMYYVISFDALNNRNPQSMQSLCNFRRGCDAMHAIACLCFFAILNAKLMFAFSFTFSINMFSNIFSL